MGLNQLEKLGLKTLVETKINEIQQTLTELRTKRDQLEGSEDTRGTEEHIATMFKIGEYQGFITGAEFVGNVILSDLSQGYKVIVLPDIDGRTEAGNTKKKDGRRLKRVSIYSENTTGICGINCQSFLTMDCKSIA